MMEIQAYIHTHKDIHTNIDRERYIDAHTGTTKMET